jgi:hypothetical protein
LVGALDAERRGGVDELVGQQQLGRSDRRKRKGAGALGGQDGDDVAVDPVDDSADLLGPVLRFDELDPRLVSGRSAITCSVGSDVPPIMITRTRLSPSACASGSMRRVIAAMSAKESS